MIASASGFLFSFESSLSLGTGVGIFGCEFTGENEGACSTVFVAEVGSVTTTDVSSETGTAITQVLPIISTTIGGNNSSGSESPSDGNSGNDNNSASSINIGRALGMIGAVAFGVVSGALML
ncbi:hypothetical protein VKT23_010155 [Stygiomarasmius scandens]|uniref:Uncharacterized protein n=1 Tax=Marasmiellus scandens TaxID=2682957 RepID=A0ABR1JD21_9AGAR